MSLIEPLVQELQHEAATTRRLLERVPEEHFGWRPHERSMTLGALASHLAEIPNWVQPILAADEFVLDMESYQPWVAGSGAELLEALDRNVATAERLLREQTERRMAEPWTLKTGGTPVFSMPRMAVVRSMILSHLIHHRGQLTVYLRLRDIPLPQVYGPTADEP